MGHWRTVEPIKPPRAAPPVFANSGTATPELNGGFVKEGYPAGRVGGVERCREIFRYLAEMVVLFLGT
jgi:hypothetical protein